MAQSDDPQPIVIGALLSIRFGVSDVEIGDSDPLDIVLYCRLRSRLYRADVITGARLPLRPRHRWHRALIVLGQRETERVRNASFNEPTPNRWRSIGTHRFAF